MFFQWKKNSKKKSVLYMSCIHKSFILKERKINQIIWKRNFLHLLIAFIVYWSVLQFFFLEWWFFMYICIQTTKQKKINSIHYLSTNTVMFSRKKILKADDELRKNDSNAIYSVLSLPFSSFLGQLFRLSQTRMKNKVRIRKQKT